MKNQNNNTKQKADKAAKNSVQIDSQRQNTDAEAVDALTGTINRMDSNKGSC
jgi:ribosomal protein L13E